LNAYLEAALDCVIMADASGRVVEFNPAAERTFGYSREEVIGQPLTDLIVPPALRERHSLAFAHFVETGERRLFGQRLELTGIRSDGSEFPVELALSCVESEPLVICGALRDLTETKRAESELRKLADEHAALHRVATLVAERTTPERDARPSEIFTAVASEVAHTLDVPLTAVIKYAPAGMATQVGAWGRENPFPVGTSWPLDDQSVSGMVFETGLPARVNDYSEVSGHISTRLAREAGIRTAVGAPILVDGRPWGAMMALSTADRELPADTEIRLAAFTELVATAISNVQARDDLRHIAAEQASLRRVATLVALETPAEELFAAVAEEVARFVDVPVIGIARYEADGTATAMGSWGPVPFPVDFPVGSVLAPHPGAIAEVRRTGLPAVVPNYAELGDEISATLVEAGFRAGFGAPIMVGRKLWGVMLALSTEEKPLPDDLEERLGIFGELIATAISNTQARADLNRFVIEQAALRKVATVVAKGDAPSEVFAKVAEEVVRLLDVDVVNIVRHEVNDTATAVASCSRIGGTIPIGTRLRLDGPSIMGMVSRTGRPARIDSYTDVPNAVTYTVDGVKINAGVGVPINVDGHVWGTVIALTTLPTPLPAGTERRLADFTELVATAISNTQARDDLRGLVDEQAALRRLATQVANGADPHDVFATVCEETGRLLAATSTNLAHFTADGFNLTMAGWSLRDTHVPTGTRLPVGTDTINDLIQRTVAPARFDSYAESAGPLAALIRERGIRSEVGAPVIVDGQVWGALIAGSDSAQPLPSGAELRVARFAELIATAVSNATTRSELIASRARIVAASDDARRRIERDLHDGTQQRLLAIGLDLQTVRAGIPAELPDSRTALHRIERDVEGVLEDVRELSRGLHPALLSQGGLRSSLKALARRSPIQVKLSVSLEARPPEPIEIAVYYVVAEALTNAVKHSSATEISVTVASVEAVLQATIEDDGRGGAETSAGSGLVGLIDRVEALGGRLSIHSPPSVGTRISIELPLSAPPAEIVREPGQGPRSRTDTVTRARLASIAVADDGLLAAIEAVADALYVVDPQGRIEYLNPAALRILGYQDESQLLGRPSHDTIHYLRPDGTPFPVAECPLLRPRVSGETVRVDEDWFVRQDGSLVPVAYASAPVQLRDGRGAVVSFREIEPPRSSVQAVTHHGDADASDEDQGREQGGAAEHRIQT
jgi:PAS domain S-box-containing protein